MRVSVLVASLAIAAAAHVQGVPRNPCWATHEYAIRSSVNQLEYRLFVALPPQCSANDTTKYAVVYALDGNDTFPLIAAVRHYLQLGGAIPPVILVGVGYPDSSYEATRRVMDLTPTSDPAFDARFRQNYVRPGDMTTTLASGGGPAFLETLRRDIIPFIERTYRTTNDRALLGHSFGGLFTVYALYAAPELFRRYGIFSPSTWWDNQHLLEQISHTTPRPQFGAARAFVAVGADEDAGMRNEADSVFTILSRTFGANLTLTVRRFSGTHMSYFPEALSPGLAYLFADPGVGHCLDSLSSVTGDQYAVLSGPEGTLTERFVRNGSAVSGGAIIGSACLSYQLTLDARGKIMVVHLAERGRSGPARTTRGEFRGSRVHFTTTDPAGERTIDIAGRTAFHVGPIIATLTPLIRESPSRTGESTRVIIANFRRADTTTAVITRIAADSIGVRLPTVEFRIHVSRQGEVLGGTTTLLPGGPLTSWIVVRQP